MLNKERGHCVILYMTDNLYVFSLITLASVREFGSYSYAISSLTKLIYPIPPIHEKIFIMRKEEQLKMIYKQLYPEKLISHFSKFYHQCKRIQYGNEIIGSCNKEGVIMAYWL